jgi:hypothetical protein
MQRALRPRRRLVPKRGEVRHSRREVNAGSLAHCPCRARAHRDRYERTPFGAIEARRCRPSSVHGSLTEATSTWSTGPRSRLAASWTHSGSTVRVTMTIRTRPGRILGGVGRDLRRPGVSGRPGEGPGQQRPGWHAR